MPAMIKITANKASMVNVATNGSKIAAIPRTIVKRPVPNNQCHIFSSGSPVFVNASICSMFSVSIFIFLRLGLNVKTSFNFYARRKAFIPAFPSYTADLLLHFKFMEQGNKDKGRMDHSNKGCDTCRSQSDYF